MDLFLFLSVMAVVVIYVLMYFPIFLSSKLNQTSSTVKLPPGKFGWPIIGETLDFVLSSRSGHPERFILTRMNKFSPQVFKTSLVGEKIAVFCGPSGNKFVFSNENTLLRGWVPRSIQKILLPDMKSRDSEELNKMRHVFSEFLKPEALKKYLHVMDYRARRHVADEWAPKRSLKVYPWAKKFTFSTACMLFLGIEDHTHIDKLSNQLELVITGLVSLPIEVPGNAFHAAVKAANSICKELKKIIRQHKLHHDMKSSLISRMFAESSDASEDQISRLLLGFLVASQDPTASLITNVIYYLADDPHVYHQVLREQNEVAKLKEPEDSLTWEDTRQMKYTRNVINETLRIATSTQGTFREAIHDITYAHFTIPKGWKIYWSVNSTHKDPRYFPYPEKFDPTRFESKGPMPYTFTPFGGGPRMCPGNEYARQFALIFMHYMVRKYSWEKIIPNEKIKFDHVQAVPENGLPIKIQPHNDQAVE